MVAEILSLSECETIISNYLGPKHGPIIDYTVKKFSDEVLGFLGDYLSVQIRVQENIEPKLYKFFAKRFPTSDLYNQYIRQIDGFSKEILVCSEVFKKFSLALPGFQADFAPKFCFGRRNDIAVFEDLNTKGYRGVQQQTNSNLLDLNHLKLVVKNLAKYHAGCVAYEEVRSKELGRKYHFSEDYKFEEHTHRKEEGFLGYGYVMSNIKGFLAIIDQLPESDSDKEEFKSKIIELNELSLSLMKPQSRFRNVLCHGDLWSNNIMFKYKGGYPIKCKLIDFQLPRFLPPAHDFLMAVLNTTNKEMRQHYFHFLVNYYYKNFKFNLNNYGVEENVLSYKEFVASINHFLPVMKLQSTLLLATTTPNPEFLKQLAKSSDDFQKFFFVDRTLYNLKLWRTDKNFKFLVTEGLNEVKDMIMYPRITREDCYKILFNKLGSNYYDFHSYKLIPCSGATGFLGNYFQLKLDVSYQMERTIHHLFIKFVPQNSSSMEFLDDSNGFLKETFIYNKFSRICDDLGIDCIKGCLPNCYLIEENRFQVFDDLVEMHYRPLSSLIFLDLEMLAIAMKKIAKFHSSTIIFEHKMSLQTGKPFMLWDIFNKSLEEHIFIKDCSKKSGLHTKVSLDTMTILPDLFLEIIDESKCDKQTFLDRFAKAREYFYKLIQPSSKYRNVICHGDLWTPNILFKFNENGNEKKTAIDCCFVDFQLTRYCPPAHDVLALMYLTTDRATRSAHMEKLIKIYYTELTQTLASYKLDIFSYNEFLESVEAMRPQMVLQSIIWHFYSCCTSEEIATLLSSEEETQKIFYEDRTDLVRTMCQTSKFYNSMIKECFEELYNLLLQFK